jgi:hypothetical protein
VVRTAKRGLEPVDVEKHDTVWKYVFHDADGNEIGLGGNVPSGKQGNATLIVHGVVLPTALRPRARLRALEGLAATARAPNATSPSTCRRKE